MTEDTLPRKRKPPQWRWFDATCEECGQTFQACRRDTRFCSRLCRKRSYRRRGYKPPRTDARLAQEARYRATHLEERREMSRRWRESHPEERREYRRRWYAANTERVRESNRQWRQANPEKVKQQTLRRTQRVREQVARGEKQHHQRTPEEQLRYFHGPDAAAAVATFWADQAGCCYLCGDPLEGMRGRSVHIDHYHGCCRPKRSCSICRRGLACAKCNNLVGLAGDDPNRLRRIADALEAATVLVKARLSECSIQEEMF